MLSWVRGFFANKDYSLIEMCGAVAIGVWINIVDTIWYIDLIMAFTVAVICMIAAWLIRE